MITGEIKGKVNRVWDVPQRPPLRTADKKVAAGRPDAVGV